MSYVNSLEDISDAQKEAIIDRNLVGLCKNTRVSNSLLDYLVEKRILGNVDVDEILAEKTSYDQAHTLYRIVPTRRFGIHWLAYALQQTNQSCAYKILLEAAQRLNVHLLIGNQALDAKNDNNSPILLNLQQKNRKKLRNCQTAGFAGVGTLIGTSVGTLCNKALQKSLTKSAIKLVKRITPGLKCVGVLYIVGITGIYAYRVHQGKMTWKSAIARISIATFCEVFAGVLATLSTSAIIPLLIIGFVIIIAAQVETCS